MKIYFFVGFVLFAGGLFGPCDTNSSGEERNIPPAVFLPSSTAVDSGAMLPDTVGVAGLRTGAERFELYLAALRDKRVALVVNHSSRLGEVHLVDTLLAQGIDIQHLFAPEHGFRGEASAGASIPDERDPATGLRIISLYGSKKKPTATDLSAVDLLVFDIQDVGARFFTYLSTLHYVMQAAAENDVPVLVLDRPNPNGHYIDGPVLNLEFSSFVGLHPVPVVYGMTIGEYARMINGEGWLGEGISVDLEVIPLDNYDRTHPYDLPIRPSPNLPNQRAVYLYPSLCFFEGTKINAGRGTAIPFQCFGAPELRMTDFSYVPRPNAGARYPKHAGLECYGRDLSDLSVDSLYTRGRLDLGYLLEAYQYYADSDDFFLATGFFDKLAGTDKLRQQISAGLTEEAIRDSWQADLEKFKLVRSKYLMYE